MYKNQSKLKPFNWIQGQHLFCVLSDKKKRVRPGTDKEYSNIASAIRFIIFFFHLCIYIIYIYIYKYIMVVCESTIVCVFF